MIKRISIRLLMVLALGAAPARADKTKARDEYKRGMAEFKLENYDIAIGHFEEGYRQEPDSAFLYNLAQAYRLSKRPVLASKFYRKFLKEPQITRKERRDVEEQLKLIEASPPDSMPAANLRPPATSITEEPSAATVTPMTLPQARTPPEATGQRKWVWGVVVGAAVLAVGAGVGVAYALPNNAMPPSSDFGNANLHF